MILSAIICVLYFLVNAQENSDKSQKSLKDVNVVVLDLCENTTIKNSQSDEIKIESYLFTKGEIWGLKQSKNRPLFKTEIKQSNDTVFVTPPIVYKPKSIGVNTYEEKIETSVYLPYNKQIIVQKADNLIVESRFPSIEIKNTDELKYYSIQKSEIKILLCEAGKELIVNEKQKVRNYEFHGTGKENYILKAKKIILTIK